VSPAGPPGLFFFLGPFLWETFFWTPISWVSQEPPRVLKEAWPHPGLGSGSLQASESVPRKVYNWETLEKKVFRKLTFALSKADARAPPSHPPSVPPRHMTEEIITPTRRQRPE